MRVLFLGIKLLFYMYSKAAPFLYCEIENQPKNLLGTETAGAKNTKTTFLCILLVFIYVWRIFPR
jgi:hypothetical protein